MAQAVYVADQVLEHREARIDLRHQAVLFRRSELFTRPRRFCSRPALVRGAEMAESRGRNSGCVADAAGDCRAGIAR